MQIHDLITPIDKQTDEQLLERIRQMRHRRETARPVAKAKAERADRKETRTRATKVDKVVDSMSPEERAKLIALLGG